MNGNDLYDGVNSAFIDLIIRSYREGRHDELERLGVNMDLAKRINELPAGSYLRFKSYGGAIVSRKMDVKRLSYMVEHAEREDRRDEHINQLILNGASQPMLETIAGVDRADFRNRRLMLGIENNDSPGRPRKLSDDEIQRIIEVTQDLDRQGIDDPIARYLELSDLKVPLSSVWLYLKFFELD